ncbi:MAG: rRNA maturation RNase YbeY [Planctomycetes bacterium]|nr:rRNA maturation RNase YbeY [Planctomycetota bacterium]
MNRILIDIKSKYLRSNRMTVQRLISAVLKRILKEEEIDGEAVNLLLVDNNQIKRYNRRYLERNRVTDVIAFGYPSPPRRYGRDSAAATQRQKEHKVITDKGIGDIVISAEKAMTEARKREIPFEQEVLRYAVHGLLHILGYDDRMAKDRKRMWKRQEEIVSHRLHG